MNLNPKILDVIACPICKGKLHFDKKAQKLICNFDMLAYPIQNGIPNMIVDQAQRIKERYKQQLK